MVSTAKAVTPRESANLNTALTSWAVPGVAKFYLSTAERVYAEALLKGQGPIGFQAELRYHDARAHLLPN